MAAVASSNRAGVLSQRNGCLQQSQARKAVVVHASAPELKRPELKRPEVPAQPARPAKLFDENAAAHAEPTVASPSKVVTLEYQRQRAKEMTKYFKDVKLQEEIVSSKVFGWTPANEINNGRWVMFGFAVGLLTEYATGVDFIEQLGQIVTYLGIADLD